MRTTLTLDSDVARQLQATVRRKKVSLKAAVNQALRIGLAMETAPKESRPFRVKVHRSGLLPGLDPHRLNQVADEIEDEAVLSRIRA
ncbi:MAG: hypothetical protein U0903_18790 [Planctomycetales bacterium]